jgi:hypothetical protein
MEYWVQAPLFEGDTKVAVKARSTPTTSRTRRGVGSLDWSRVTRDPDVAASYTTSSRAASDIRIGLARAFGNLAPEQRNAIRAALDPSRRPNAA